jgi:ACS family hexuronate transporter-like MFS transporter
MLFASTTIIYLDRQTLSLLAPYLKISYHWNNSDYVNLVIAFRIAYSIGQTVCGRWMDRIGTRLGITFTVFFYSFVSVLTPLANGLLSFMGFRVALGFAESANWPTATKVVSEWFPARERALATAFFDSGSSVGGALAPFLVLWIYFHWGWRLAFIVPGILGFLWLLVWRKFYFHPEQHPRISVQEREMLRQERHADESSAPAALIRWRDLLRLPQTWGVIAARTFTDPVWYFVTDWFPIYLVAKGIDLRNGMIAVWVPFLAADLGNFAGGAASDTSCAGDGHLVGRARRLLSQADAEPCCLSQPCSLRIWDGLQFFSRYRPFPMPASVRLQMSFHRTCIAAMLSQP